MLMVSEEEELVQIADENCDATPLLDSHGHSNTGASATAASSVVNLANTILGAGLLGLPHAFSACGFAFGGFMMVFGATASATGLYLLGASTKLLGGGTQTFYSVAHAATPRFAFLIDLAVAIKCFGVGTSYLIVMGDVMPAAAGNPDGLLGNRHFWITLLTWGLVAPLAYLRDLNSLRYTSTVSLFFVLYMALVILLYAVVPDSAMDPCLGFAGGVNATSQCRGPTELVIADTDTLKVLSVYIFAYTCHQNIFSIINELKDPTQKRINTVIGTAVGSSLGVYAVVAFAGYYTFGSMVKSDIIENYPKNLLMTFSRVFIALLTAFSYPLQCHPCRNSTSQLFLKTQTRTWKQHVIMTTAILLGSYGIAMVLNDLGVVLAVVGATGSTTISYVLPGLVYVSLQKTWNCSKVAAAILLALGIIIIPTCLTFIFVFGAGH